MKWRLLAVACVLLALGLLLYPLMGELVSEKYHSDVEAVYTAVPRQLSSCLLRKPVSISVHIVSVK